MGITYRAMRPNDVRECIEIVRAHPVVGPRYGAAISSLGKVWIGLLDEEAFRPVVFEETRQSYTRIIGIGVSAFLSEDFLRALKTAPFFWVGPELTRRIARSESPLLSNREVRERNGNGGLNVVTWENALRTEFFDSVEVLTIGCNAFFEQHRGFLLKEVLGQAATRDLLDLSVRSGFLLMDRHGRYVDSVTAPLGEIFAEPHHFGVTRDLGLPRVGTWIGTLFVYQPPQCGFRPSEQRLLLAALRGRTDEELADELGLSISAVKKMWLSIYERVSTHLPCLLPSRASKQKWSERGKEKKQRMIAYLREHPEELRPALPR
jgi:hypothetical protein